MIRKEFSCPQVFFVITLMLGLFAVCLPLNAETRKKEDSSKASSSNVRKMEVQVGEDTESADPSFQNAQDAFDPLLSQDGDPLAEIHALQARVQKLFDESLSRGLKTSAEDILFPSHSFEPPVNIEDRGDKLHITLDLPGMKKEDIQVTVKDRVLTVSGRREGKSEERKEEKGRKVYRQERFSGGFKRNISLPVSVKEDTVKAKYQDGVLIVEALKEEALVDKRKRIVVE